MTTFKIKFDNRVDLDNFVMLAQECKGKIYAHSIIGDKVVSAKSPLGLMSLGKDELIINLDNDDDMKIFAKYELLKDDVNNG